MNQSMKSEEDDKRLVMSEKDILRTYYEGLLRETGGNIAAAARIAKLKDSTFRNRLKKYGIR